MENKYVLAAIIAIAAAGVLAVGVSNAHDNDDYNGVVTGNSFGMGSMMGMMGGFAHDQDDIELMREEMNEYMNLTDGEFDDMAEHCPMMQSR